MERKIICIQYEKVTLISILSLYKHGRPEKCPYCNGRVIYIEKEKQ